MRPCSTAPRTHAHPQGQHSQQEELLQVALARVSVHLLSNMCPEICLETFPCQQKAEHPQLRPR